MARFVPGGGERPEFPRPGHPPKGAAMAGNDLGSLLGGLLGGGQRDGSGTMLAALLGTVGAGGGANPLNGLLEELRDGGLGEQAGSWVGTGENRPISGPELAQALPYQNLDHVARQAGVTPEQAADRLAAALPEAVDKLTPGGEVPQGDLEEIILRRQPGR
ncbi:YidB family protein [Streptomyces sp. NPDC018031]|uniref:YidB family protein n=1 Tax=Streptomyces sp. NPDC018031 TaxID=3365033 RepID=UPI0037A03FEB